MGSPKNKKKLDETSPNVDLIDNELPEDDASAVLNAPDVSDYPGRAGFVSIVGKPNVGKSTLMNQLVGERLSIITSKAQTTRHRIMGILNGTHEGEPFQMVYSDTPGIIKPMYKLHESMMNFVRGSLEDADVILFVTDIFEKHDEDDVLVRLQNADVPIILLVNKIDQAHPEQVEEKLAYWSEHFSKAQVMPISALYGDNLEELFDTIIGHLPHHPPYFPTDELTDRPERFFASEIIREKIFLNYKKEIPYSSEVIITGFKEKDDILVISSEILVERPTQRAILLGEGGKMIKKTGIMAREELEQFFQKKVFLETFVKVEPDWRNKEKALKRFGYDD